MVISFCLMKLKLTMREIVVSQKTAGKAKVVTVIHDTEDEDEMNITKDDSDSAGSDGSHSDHASADEVRIAVSMWSLLIGRVSSSSSLRTKRNRSRR